MKNKILILGKGYIGERLHETLGWPISSQRILQFDDVLSQIKKYKPKVIVNCIGHTGKSNVDDCELALDKTLSANTFIPILLAEAAIRNNIKLIHLSSGCIYHYDYAKTKPITENKTPDFYNLYYSRTKIYTENVLEQMAKRFNILVARVRIPLDNRPHPKNVLTKLIKYKRVIDIPNSTTYVPDFIAMLQHLIKIDARGIYNTVNAGGLRYPRLLDIYRRYHPDFDYTKISLKQLNLTRTNLVLSTKKLEQTGFKLRSINEVLEECVKDYVRMEASSS